MCQLVRFRVSSGTSFREALSRIPSETWVTVHDDHVRSDEPGTLWTTLAALDVLREHGVVMEPIESLEAELIPVFYGPGATVHAKLMAADLRCSVLAAGAIGAVRAGDGSPAEVARKTDLPAADLLAWQPPFSPPYVWLLIRRREDARRAADRLFPGSDTARQWAERFGVSSLPALLKLVQPGIPPKLVPERA